MALNQISLRSRIVLIALIVELIILAALVFNATRLVDDAVEREAATRIGEVAPLINAALAPLVFQRDRASLQAVLAQLIQSETLGTQYVDVTDASLNRYAHVGLEHELHKSTMPAKTVVSRRGDVVDLHTALTVGNQTVGSVHYGLSLSSLVSSREQIVNQTLLITGIAIVVSIIVLSLAAGALTRRLVHLTTETEHAVAALGHTQSKNDNTDEIGRLERAIHDLLHAEQNSTTELRRGQQRFRTFAEAASDWFWESDRDGRYTYVSERLFEILGIDANEIIGKTRWELQASSDLQLADWDRHAEKLKQQEPFRDLRVVWNTPVGGARVLLVSGTPVHDERGVFAGYRGVGQDITNQDFMEQQLRSSQQRYYDLYEHAPDIYLSVDAASGQILDCNYTCTETLGYSRDELLRMRVQDLYDASDQPQVHELLTHFSKTGVIRDAEMAIRGKDGTRLDVSLNVSAIRDHDGRIVASRSVLRDISARTAAEEKLRLSESRFRDFAELGADWFWEMDNQLRFSFISGGFEKVLGLKASDLLGRTRESVWNLDTSNLSEDWQRHLDATTAFRRVTDFESEWTHRDGSTRIVSISSKPILDNSGQACGMRGVGRDNTLIRAAERHAREQSTKLEQARRLAGLGTLVAGVAHEINNPTNLILLNSEILASAWDDARDVLDEHANQHGEFSLGQIPYAEMRNALPAAVTDTRDAARRIQRIVDELKSAGREQVLPPSALVNLNDVVQSACGMLANTIETNRVCMSYQLGAQLRTVRGDAHKLEQVVMNLLSNAIQSLVGHDRRVDIITAAGPTADSVQLRVEDTGRGIKEKDRHRVFDPFFTTRQAEGGTGLGLWLCYRQVAEHGGTLSLNARAQGGTQVVMVLPAAETA